MRAGEFENFVKNLWFVKDAECHIQWYLGVGAYAGRSTAVIMFPDERRMTIIGDETGIYIKVRPANDSQRNGYSVYEIVGM